MWVGAPLENSRGGFSQASPEVPVELLLPTVDRAMRAGYLDERESLAHLGRLGAQ